MFRHNFPFVGHFPADEYTDLKLTTLEEEAEGGGRDVPCHKVVMAAVSKKLEVIIDKRGGDDLLVVRNVRFEILQKVVEFVYMGSVEVEEGVDEQDVIDALDMLLIKFEAENEVDPQFQAENEVDPQVVHAENEFDPDLGAGGVGLYARGA